MFRANLQNAVLEFFISTKTKMSLSFRVGLKASIDIKKMKKRHKNFSSSPSSSTTNDFKYALTDKICSLWCNYF